MKPKMKLKMLTDIGMTVCLLLLMTYELISSAFHEYVGMGMFVLFILHHVWNIKWSKNLFRGTYTAFRVLQTLLVFIICFTMIGSMISGVILSNHLFTFLPINGGRGFSRTLHLLCAYWGFVLMSLHLGLHWNMIVGMAKRLHVKSSKIILPAARGIAIAIAGYGVYAFIKRDVGTYMFLKNQFVFFDFEEPIALFLIDYMFIMGLFVFIGHYLGRLLLGYKGRGSVAKNGLDLPKGA